jgi:hypothetical protein
MQRSSALEGIPATLARFLPERAAMAVLYGVALLPALVLLRGIDLYAVDVPFMDDWQFIPLVEKVHGGEIPWRELAAPHDEHRLLIPRILIAASMILGHGNYRVQCFVTFATVLVLSLALLFLLRRAFGDEPRTAVFFGLANVVLFSPIQWHNWLWPMQFCYFLPYTFLFLGLAGFSSRLAAGWRYAILQGCAWAATFSFVQGLLLWPVLAPVVWRDPRWPSPRWRRAATGVWIAAAVLATGLYFHNLSHNTALPDYAYFHKGEPPTASTLRLFERNPLATSAEMAAFAAMMFGNAMGRGLPVASNLSFATASGALLLAVGVALWIGLARGRRLGAAETAWAAVFTHAFLTAGLVAVGRVWAGPGQPLTPRYATFGTFCILGVLLFAFSFFTEISAERGWRDLALLVCGALLATVATGWSFGWNLLGEWHDVRLASRAAVHFSQLLPVPMLYQAGGQGNVLVPYARTLDRLGYLDPPLAEDLRLDRFTIGADLPGDEGRLQRVSVGPRSSWRVRGRARFGSGGHTPDAILATTKGASGDPMIRAVCETRSPPRWLRHATMRDYQFAYRSPKTYYGSFRCRLRDKAIPPGERGDVQFWALDFARFRVHRIRGAVDLSRLEVSDGA